MAKRDLNICLIKLAEECGEVVQVACKAHRYGLDNFKPGKTGTNRELLIEELGDIQAYQKILIEDTDSGVTYEAINQRCNEKYEQIKLNNIVPEVKCGY